MHHIIATRLGLGIARETFFENHVRMMLAGLYRSLRNQTDRDFEWVVMADRCIDAGSERRVRQALETMNGRLILHDPIASGKLIPRGRDIIGPCKAERILMTRIDDDDLLCEDFVARIKEAAREHASGTVSITLADGLDLHFQFRMYREYVHVTTPVGASLLFDRARGLSVYGYNHNKLHERIEAVGGKGVVLRSERPMWIYTRRPSSDSSELRNAFDRTRLVKEDALLYETVERCGLDRKWVGATQRFYLAENDPKPEIVGETRLNRLSIKNEILGLLKEMRANGQSETGRFHALVSAFYAF